MKRLIITMICLFSSMFAFAENNITFVNADGSDAGELCIAAANNERK